MPASFTKPRLISFSSTLLAAPPFRFDGKVTSWWLPDDVVFVDKIPHTATGKIQKNALRETFRDYRLPGPQAGR